MYTPQTWIDYDETKSLSASRMGYIEAGVEAAHKAVDLAGSRIFNVRDTAFAGGAKGDGVISTGAGTDDTAAIAAARAALINAGGGTLYFPPSAGAYKCTSLPDLQPPVATGPLPYAIRGAGSAVSVINLRGTSPAASLTVSNPNFNVDNASDGAPTWSGFRIDGTGSTGGCSGLRWSDVSYPSFADVDIRNFTTGDGMFFPNLYGWTEGVNMVSAVKISNCANLIRFDVGSGTQLGVITSTIASGASATSIAVSGGVTKALYSGQPIVIAANVSAVGVVTQTVVTTAAVSVGATSIPVTSFVAATAYTSGTARAYWGGYGSFDYWSVHDLFLKAFAGQHGIVSEQGRGINGDIQRLGSHWRVTGNFRRDTTNTGRLLWLKGKDNWDYVTWNMNVETGGSGVAHQSIKCDTGDGFVGGVGQFHAYYFAAASFAGGSYQFGVSGRVCVAGISNANGDNAFLMTRPFARNTDIGVSPSGYLGSAPTSGTSWQNTTGFDLLVKVIVTATGTFTAAVNVDVWNGLPAGTTEAAGPSGTKYALTFVHYAGKWARVDFTNATVSAPIIRYI